MVYYNSPFIKFTTFYDNFKKIKIIYYFLTGNLVMIIDTSAGKCYLTMVFKKS